MHSLQKNILIVDGNQDILDALADDLCLFMNNCIIHTAKDGKLGGEMMRSMSIDLVLTDIDRSSPNGYRFIEQARKDFPAVPVCVMTGNCSPSMVNHLASIGVVRRIEKPFKFSTLARVLTEELDQADERHT